MQASHFTTQPQFLAAYNQYLCAYTALIGLANLFLDNRGAIKPELRQNFRDVGAAIRDVNIDGQIALSSYIETASGIDESRPSYMLAVTTMRNCVDKLERLINTSAKLIAKIESIGMTEGNAYRYRLSLIIQMAVNVMESINNMMRVGISIGKILEAMFGEDHVTGGEHEFV